LLLPFAIALGLLLGSFLNVVIHRLPRGESVVHPPSHCPACGKTIRFYNNVPVASWLLLGGRAACCGVRISPRYVLVELLGGLAGFAVLSWVMEVLPGETPWYLAVIAFVLYLSFVCALIAALFIDFEYMLLPDELTLGLGVVGLLTIFVRPIDLASAGVGAVGGFLLLWLPFIWLYEKIRGYPGMGLGDAKLMFATGAWLGFQGAVFALLAGAVQGTLAALVVYLSQGRIEEPAAVRREREQLLAELAALEGPEREALERELEGDLLAQPPPSGLARARLAFGPFLALASIEYLFFGEWLVQAYLDWIVQP
jgi:leader peptidase (prepilin peptidase)/N-methyltransferase